MSDAPIPAATLVIMRDRIGAPPDVLMVERTRSMAFAPGAMVFPGGRVDAGDHAIAATLGDDPDGEIAARIAAIRETIEEVGLAIGLTPDPDQRTIDTLRVDLAGGMAFAAALDRAGCRIDPGVLVAFARWLPAHMMTRVFDTRFYLARAPSGPVDQRVDGTENVRLAWTGAAAALDDADAARATIIYPTRRNLERLATFASFDEAVANARLHPVETITPSISSRDGVEHLCIPEGLGYPVTSEPVSRAFRG